MILSDTTIESRIDELVKQPLVDEEQVQPASLDLRLGHELYVPHEDKTYNGQQSIGIPPGVPLIAHSLDLVTIPLDLAALLTGRSSVGRAGVIVHKTAGWIDPGFEGQVRFEMYNFGEDVQYFEPGDRVAQLVFFKLDDESVGYDGQYQGQTGASDG